MVNIHNDYLGYRVYEAQRWVSKCLEVALKPYGITSGQWNLINQLDMAGSLSQKALAERTNKEQATITRYLDKLETMGLIVRERDESDRRAHLIVITEKAKDLLKETEVAANAAAACLRKDIPQDKIEVFIEVLTAIRKNSQDFVEENSRPQRR